MAGQAPKSRYASFPCSGVLNEILTPAAVGGSGLTACQNLIYHRQGAWGKRTGSASVGLPQGTIVTPVSGFRWYRGFPQPLTTTVIYSQEHLFIGPNPASLVDLGKFPLSGTVAPDFCTIRDPQANGGVGADILVIAGITIKSGSFGTGTITITGLPDPQPPAGTFMQITLTNNGGQMVTTPKYYILGTDDPGSIADQLVQLINETEAFLDMSSKVGFFPYIGEAYYTASTPPIGALNTAGHGQSGVSSPSAVIYLGARKGGAAGNLISYSITMNNTTGGDGTPLSYNAAGQSVVTSMPSTANFTGGGATDFTGLARYEVQANAIEGLSYMAPNAFTGCTSWHNHLWAWGDSSNPDTVFASDIYQPEAWTFMIENGPVVGANVGTMSGPQNGGYTIGAGDGDPAVQSCIPLGNALYVFKANNIYMIEGYDFQQGEYAFSVTPQIAGYGIPSRDCAAVLENELVFWSGRKFLRLATGAYEPEHIGLPIPLTEGIASNGQQPLVKAFAGDLQVLAALNNNYGLPQPFSGSTILYRSMAMWAMDFGDGRPDTVVVYDDEATQERGSYAWSVWTGWNVGCWIPYGNGPAPGGGVDPPKLHWINPHGTEFVAVGNDAADDNGNPIPWMAQTGFVDFQTAEVLKNAHRMFLNSEANPGAVFTAEVAPGRIVWSNGQTLPYGTTPTSYTFSPTQGPSGGEAFNDMEVYLEPLIQAKSIILQLTEPGTALKGFEVISWGIDILPEEAFAG